MLEITMREADGGERCTSVGCRMDPAGLLLDARCKPTQSGTPTQARAGCFPLFCYCGG